jgi:hypothetical protein
MLTVLCCVVLCVHREVPHTLTTWVYQYSRDRAWPCCSSLPMQTAHLMHGKRGEGWVRSCRVCVHAPGRLCSEHVTGLCSTGDGRHRAVGQPPQDMQVQPA